MSDDDYYKGYTQSLHDNADISSLSENDKTLMLVAAVRRQQISTDEKIDVLMASALRAEESADKAKLRATELVWAVSIFGALALGRLFHLF